MTSHLKIIVDAGFKDFRAGLGVWIPAIGTGVALGARAKDNNEAETLAILLGAIIAKLMVLRRPLVLTDSLLNVTRLENQNDLSGPLLTASLALKNSEIAIQWLPRELTVEADFFATLALDGKNLIASSPNANDFANRFRPLLKVCREDKVPIKNVQVKWLSLPGPSNSAFNASLYGLQSLAKELDSLMNVCLPMQEFRKILEVFCERAQKAYEGKKS